MLRCHLSLGRHLVPLNVPVDTLGPGLSIQMQGAERIWRQHSERERVGLRIFVRSGRFCVGRSSVFAVIVAAEVVAASFAAVDGA